MSLGAQVFIIWFLVVLCLALGIGMFRLVRWFREPTPVREFEQATHAPREIAPAITVTPRRRIAWLWAGGLLLLLVASVSMLRSGPLFQRIVGGFALAIGVSLVATFVPRLLSGRPLLTVRDHGVDYPGLGLIAWDEIAKVTIKPGFGLYERLGRRLEIELACPADQQNARRLPPWHMARIVRAITRRPLSISLINSFAPMGVEGLKAEIERRAGWLPEARSSRGGEDGCSDQQTADSSIHARVGGSTERTRPPERVR